jgi:eukaryotic-like serine/threonine-protein kinase
MASLMPQDLWRTVRRARLIQVLTVYLASAFVVLQATDILVDRLALPDWVFPVALVLLLIGLPMVMATAIVQSGPADRGTASGAPDGESGAAEAADAESAPLAGPTALSEGGRPSDRQARWDPDGDGRVTLGDVAMVARQWLTWHRTLAGGIAAFLLLALAVSGYTAMRTFGIGPVGSLLATGVIEERERILVADFESATDPALAGVVTEAFRIDFGQSPILTVVDPAAVRDALGRMGRDPADGLDHALAREVALRDGITALVTGEVAAAGTGYVLTARLLSVANEEVLAGLRESARDDADLIPAIDRLSKRLRERIGESLRTIRAAPPLADVTTPSIEALRRYTLAIHAEEVDRDRRRALSLLEDAIALDSAFAMAHRKLAVVLGNLGEDRSRQREAVTRAYQHLDRLSEWERQHTAGQYHRRVTGDTDRELRAYRAMLDLDPDDPSALNNIGTVYGRMRDWERAAEYYRRASQADTTSTLSLFNLIGSLLNLGRNDEARDLHRELERRFPGNRLGEEIRIGFALLAYDFEEAERQIARYEENWIEDPDGRLAAAYSRTAVATLQGRLTDAERHWGRVGEERERGGRAALLLADAVTAAEHRLHVARDTAGAVAVVDHALARYPLDGIDAYDRPYVDLALFRAAVGDADRIRALIASFDAELGGDAHRGIRQDRAALDVALALGERRWRDVHALIPAAEQAVCHICWHPLAGIAHEGSGDPDSAIAAYTAYVETPSAMRPLVDPTWRGFVHERLADLHLQRDEHEVAAYYAANQLELWDDPDPELRPRVEALQAVLHAAVRERPQR